MTKQEKIKEAWGEYYDKIKNDLDEHGRYNYYDNIPAERKRKLWQFENIVCSVIENTHLLIPSIIKGIETNNGWNILKGTKNEIQYEGDIWILNKHGEIELWLQDQYQYLPIDYATHWKSVIKPLKPIY